MFQSVLLGFVLESLSTAHMSAISMLLNWRVSSCG